MKRLMLVLTAFVAGLSLSWGQLDTYTAEWQSDAYLTAPSEGVTTLATFTADEDISIRDLSSYTHQCYVFESTGKRMIYANKTNVTAIPFGFNFQWGSEQMTHFLPMGDGSIVLGNAENIQAGCMQDITNMAEYGPDNTYKDDAVMLIPVTYHSGNGPTPTRVIAADDNSAVRYWSTEDALVVEYSGMKLSGTGLADNLRSASFILSWQVQFGKDGSVTFAFSGAQAGNDGYEGEGMLGSGLFQAPLALNLAAFDNASMYAWSTQDEIASTRKYVDGTGDFILWDPWNGIPTFYNYISMGLQVDASHLPTEGIGVKIAGAELSDCTAPSGTLTWAVEGYSELRASTNTLSFPMVIENTSTLTADDYLFVLSTNSDAPSFHPEDGQTYEPGNQGEETILSYNTNSGYYSLYAANLESSTTYYLYVYPFNNELCIGGPVYSESAYLVVSASTLEGAPAIESLALEADKLNLTLDASGKNVLALYMDAPFDLSGMFGEWGSFRPDGDNAPADMSTGSVYATIDGLEVKVAHYGEYTAPIEISDLIENRVYTVVVYTETDTENHTFTQDFSSASAYVPATTLPVTYGPYPEINVDASSESGDWSYLINYTEQWPATGWGEQPLSCDMNNYLYTLANDVFPGRYERVIRMNVSTTPGQLILPAFTTDVADLNVSLDLSYLTSTNLLGDLQANDSVVLLVGQPTADGADTTWTEAEVLYGIQSLPAATINNLYTWNVNATVDPTRPVLLQVAGYITTVPSDYYYNYYLLIKSITVSEGGADVAERPASLTFSNVSDNAATAHWSKCADATGYLFSYGVTGAMGEETYTTDTTASMTGLEANTDYIAQVRAVYADDTSSYREARFTTMQALPIDLDFNSMQSMATVPGATQHVLSGDAFTSGSGWFIYSYNDRYNVVTLSHDAHVASAMYALPEFYADADAEAYFSFSAGYGNDYRDQDITSMDQVLAADAKVEIIISQDNFATWTVLGTVTRDEMKFREATGFTFPISVEESGAARIGINLVHTNYNESAQTAIGTSYFFVDALRIDNVPDSYYGLFTTNNQLGTPSIDEATGTVTLSWDPIEGASSYVVRYAVFDFDNPSLVWLDTLMTVNTSVDVEGLSYSTAYTTEVWPAIDFAGRYYTTDQSVATPIFIDFSMPCGMPSTLNISAAQTTATFLTVPMGGEKVLQVYDIDSTFFETYAWSSDVINFEVTGLTPETEYWARVRAVCSEGDSSNWTTPKSFTTLAEGAEVICGAPAGLTANPGIEDADLSWTAGENNLEYEVFYKEADAAEFTMLTVAETVYELTSLTAETEYAWRVAAVCANDMRSDTVDGQNFTTQAEPVVCTTPANLEAVAGVDTAALSWTAGEEATAFEVLYRASDAAAYTLVNAAETQTVLRGLTAETAYNWTVVAVCGDVKSDTAAVATFTTKAAPGPQPAECEAPANLNAVPGVDTAALSWTAGAGNESYEVLYKAEADAEYTSVAAAETAHVLTGLAPQTNYDWTVVGVCADNMTDTADVVTFATLAGSANEAAWAASLRVYSQNGMIHIYNPGKLMIDRVMVYTTAAAQVANVMVRADNNVQIPVEGGRILLVRVISGENSAVYKLYVR